MTYDQALVFFGSGRAVGKVLSVSGSRVSQCRSAGGFSYPMQCVLEKESHGRLLADREDDPSFAAEYPPTVEQIMTQKSPAGQSTVGAVNPSSTARTSP